MELIYPYCGIRGAVRSRIASGIVCSRAAVVQNGLAASRQLACLSVPIKAEHVAADAVHNRLGYRERGVGAMAASTAEPLRASICVPASEAKAWLVATIPRWENAIGIRSDHRD
jgi:hypothetical protein